MITAAGEYVAFCSTTAIYFVRLKDFKVERAIATHDQIITSISASPQKPFLLASSNADGNVTIWDVENEKPESSFYLNGSVAVAIEFSPLDSEGLLLITDSGICILLCSMATVLFS